MEIVFAEKYLKELYLNGKSSDKKHRFQTSVVNKYQKRIDTLMAASRIEDLFAFNSLHFEALSGRKDEYSIRIDLSYRLIFKVTSNNLSICFIEEISKHYE